LRNVRVANKENEYLNVWLKALALGLSFVYFDVYFHYWFLNLTGGYVFKIWLPPLMMLLCTAVVVLWKLNLRPNVKGLGSILAIGCLYLFFGSLSLLRHESTYFAVKYGLVMFGPLMVLTIGLLAFQRESQISFVLKIFLIIGLLFCIYVLYLNDFLDYIALTKQPYILKHMWSDKTTVTSLSLNYVGDLTQKTFFARSRTLKFIDEPAFSAMLIPLVLYGFHLAAQNLTRWGRYLYFLPAFLLWTMTNTGSRGSIVGFCVGLLVYLYFIREKKKDVRIILTLTFVLFCSNPYLLYRAAQTLGQVIKLLGGPNFFETIPINYDGHVLSIAKTFEAIKNSPVWGVGVSNFSGEFASPEWGMGVEHNRYLYIFATTGLVTILPYVCLIAGLIIKAARTVFKSLNRQSLGPVLLGSSIALAVHLNNCGQERYYYWIIFGFTAAWIKIETENQFVRPKIFRENSNNFLEDSSRTSVPELTSTSADLGMM